MTTRVFTEEERRRLDVLLEAPTFQDMSDDDIALVIAWREKMAEYSAEVAARVEAELIRIEEVKNHLEERAALNYSVLQSVLNNLPDYGVDTNG